MDLESATKDVEAVGVDSREQETRPKKANSGGTERVPGKSVFPVARVQKILKADKELPTVAKEAVFLVSMATELFIKRLALAAQIQAAQEKRATVQTKDIAIAVRKEGEYFFLEGEALLRFCGLCKGATDMHRKEIMASLPADALAVSTKQRKTATTGEEDTPSVTIMQAFAKAGKKDAKRTETRQKAAGEGEGSAEGDAEETQENPFDEEIQGVEDDTATSPPISTPANRSPASIRPIDIDTDEEMEDV